LFIAFDTFFELLFGFVGIDANRMFWPIALMILGILVLFGRFIHVDHLIDQPIQRPDQLEDDERCWHKQLRDRMSRMCTV